MLAACFLAASHAGLVAGSQSDQPTDAGSTHASLEPARDLLMHGHYDAATAAFEEFARNPEHQTEAALGLARCRLATGRYEEGIRGLHKHKATDSPVWHTRLAEFYVRTGKYAEAGSHLARAVELDPNDTRARLKRAELAELLGRRDETIDQYRWFDRQLVEKEELPEDAEWLTAAALGFVRYSVLTRTNLPQRIRHALHEMLQPAYERVDRTYWPARIAAGDLLRARYNNSEEDGSVSDYRAALKINEHLPEAQIGLGEVALADWKFEEVEKRAELALEVNPRFAPALHLLAKKLIVERRYEEAVEACDRALTTNPNDLTALSLAAAAYACQFDEDGVTRMRERVAKLNPSCAEYHRTLGDALGGIRQYPDSERAYLTAIDLEPTDANARTELGMMYMQWGLEDKARDALDAAWALDPFNERTKFTLDLLDMLESFDEVRTEHFVVKYDRRKDPGLGEYIAGYLEPIYDEVIADYETPLEHDTIIEVFPTHRQFGVRITGKPWIHTIGACTGRVIALASPRGAVDLMGPYNIRRVLKHEFTHTVTLAATRNRIPHWFTEGLAVYGEDSPRSFGWAELLADAVRRDELFTLDSIDWGFMRPRKPSDRQMAYAQSEWMCEFIVQRFGYAMIHKMLERYHAGQTQDEVLRGELKLTPQTFDEQFHEWAQDEARAWCFDLTPPGDPERLREQAEGAEDAPALLGRLAKAELDAGNLEAAVAAARRALALDENEPDALDVVVRALAAYAKQEGSASARREYEEKALEAAGRLRKVDPQSWRAAKLRAEILLRRGRLDEAREPLRVLQRLCPLDPASWRGLAGIYLQRAEDERALPQLLELARLDGTDVGIRAELARIHSRQGRLYDARYWYEQALGIDPLNVDLHRALGDLNMRLGDAAAALREYKMLTKLEPERADHFASAAFAAQKLGDSAEAGRFAQRAVELDPTSPAAGLLP